MHLFDLKLSYFSVPKCANTSVKTFLFKVENGFDFRPFVSSGTRFAINRVAVNVAFDKQPHQAIAGHKRVAVVRSPLERVVSLYGDKIVNGSIMKRQSGERIRAAGLNVAPSLEEFVDRIEEYRDVDKFMFAHMAPLSHFLGTDASYFTTLYRMSEIPKLVFDVNKLANTDYEIPHMNRGGRKKAKFDPLGSKGEEKIKKLYAEDYDVFGKYLDA